MRIAIIGCGNIGEKRIRSLEADDQVVICADLNESRARTVQELAQKLNKEGKKTSVTDKWEQAVSSPDIDVVLVATTHQMLPIIAAAALERKKHVFLEKPAAKKASDLDKIIRVSAEQKLNVHVGFNHRFHRAFRKARELVDSNEIGPLMFIRSRYGHGGRLGYDKEWRANPDLSGGGELIDQGMHVIDLSQWFLGNFSSIKAKAHTYYWDMPVDDNAFMILEASSGTTAFLQVSCTEWKNMFSFEIYGRTGKLEISGLGGSYGVERLSFYKMGPQMGPPETIVWEYPQEDDSWKEEWKHFKKLIKASKFDQSTLIDAQKSLKIVEEVYRQSGYHF